MKRPRSMGNEALLARVLEGQASARDLRTDFPRNQRIPPCGDSHASPTEKTMTDSPTIKLSFHKETLRILDDEQLGLLDDVLGGREKGCFCDGTLGCNTTGGSDRHDEGSDRR